MIELISNSGNLSLLISSISCLRVFTWRERHIQQTIKTTVVELEPLPVTETVPELQTEQYHKQKYRHQNHFWLFCCLVCWLWWLLFHSYSSGLEDDKENYAEFVTKSNISLSINLFNQMIYKLDFDLFKQYFSNKFYTNFFWNF